ESIFEGTGTPPFPITNVENCSTNIILDPTDPRFPMECACASLGIPLGPGGGAPNNQGLQVEGAFANGLWGVFEHQGVGKASASAHVPERANEQVVTDAPWVRNVGVRTNFLNEIWRPLGDLTTASGVGAKTTGRMIEAMERLNPTTWHFLQPELQAFNM